MTIADFACSINSCLPSIEQIKAHNLRVEERMKERALKITSTEHDLELIEKSRSQMMFTYDIDRETDVMEEKLCQLIERTNIQWRPSGFQWNPPGALNFYNEIRKSTFIDDGLEFAVCNDYEKICMNRQTSNIIWYFEDQWDFEILARDLDQFMSFVVECHRYEMHYIYNVDYAREERFKVLKTLIKQGLSYSAVSQFINDFK